MRRKSEQCESTGLEVPCLIPDQGSHHPSCPWSCNSQVIPSVDFGCRYRNSVLHCLLDGFVAGYGFADRRHQLMLYLTWNGGNDLFPKLPVEDCLYFPEVHGHL